MHPLKKKHRGVEQLVARQAHNLEVACSNPASATTKSDFVGLFFCIKTLDIPDCSSMIWSKRLQANNDI